MFRDGFFNIIIVVNLIFMEILENSSILVPIFLYLILILVPPPSSHSAVAVVQVE